VSVIIPARDAEAGITAAVESALDQPEVLEVVVVNDGSIDHTAEVVTRLAARDRRVTIVNPTGAPVGPGAARNAGAKVTRSELLAFLDADDVFLPGAFTEALPQFTDRGVDLVVSRLETHYLDPEQDPLAPPCDPGPLSARDWLKVLCRGETGIPVCAALVRKRAFQGVGGFSEALPLGQDLVLWIKLACMSRLAVSRSLRPIAIYQRHGRNRSHVGGRQTVQSGALAFLEAWRWARTSIVHARYATAVLQGAGVRQRQLMARALRGDVVAGTWALRNLLRAPAICANRGFWRGAAIFPVETTAR